MEDSNPIEKKIKGAKLFHGCYNPKEMLGRKKLLLISVLLSWIFVLTLLLPQASQSREFPARIIRPPRFRHYSCSQLKRITRVRPDFSLSEKLSHPCSTLENLAWILLNLSGSNLHSENFANLLSNEIRQNFTLEDLKQALAEGLTEEGPITSFSLNSFVLQRGEWAETKVQLTTSRNQTQLFKVILHLEDGQWKIFGTQPIQDFVAGEVIVKLKGHNKPNKAKLNSNESVSQAIQRMKRTPDVEFAEPNFVANAQMIPNDPYYNPYQWNFPQVNAETAWETSTGAGVVVAVIDTGVAYEEYRRYQKAPDLSQTAFAPGFDFVEDDTHPNDDHGHGTHVAGTIAQSTNNLYGVAGLAFEAQIMPIKVLDRRGGGTYFDIAQGIYWAVDHGAKVINLSLGGKYDSKTLKQAVSYAYEKGVVVVAAAGNDGQVGSNAILYPAAYDEYVLAVGAVRFDQQKTWYSNGGPLLDLVAPGGDLEIDQNQDGYADGILQQTIRGYRAEDEFAFYFFQGTSMAAPHVSAAAAMLFSKGITNPTLIMNFLKETATDLGVPGKDDQYGFGLINLGEALQAIGSGQGTSPIPTPLPTLTPTLTPSPIPEPTATLTPTFTPTSTEPPTQNLLELTAQVTDRRGNPQTSFMISDRIYLEGRVSSNEKAIAKVVLDIAIKNPAGEGIKTWQQETNFRGEFDEDFRLSRNAPLGQYQVQIIAQKESYLPASIMLAFEVL